MKRIVQAFVVVAVAMLAACSYTHNTETTTTVITENPDGSFTLQHTKVVDDTTITLQGDSWRDLIRQLPELDSRAAASELLKYRYEYRFDVYNINGVFVGTVSVETLEEALAVLPDLYAITGMNPPPASELAELEDELIANWISPQTHWNLYH